MLDLQAHRGGLGPTVVLIPGRVERRLKHRDEAQNGAWGVVRREPGGKLRVAVRSGKPSAASIRAWGPRHAARQPPEIGISEVDRQRDRA